MGTRVQESEVIIREVETTDLDALASFFESNNLPEIVQHFHPFPLTFETAQMIACAEHLDRYYIALVDGQPVGLAMLRGWDEGFSVPSFGVMIDHRFQGQGYGRRMLEHALQEANRLGCHRVRLTVYVSNQAALRLYRSVGFYEAMREAVTVAERHDEKLIMFKDLR